MWREEMSEWVVVALEALGGRGTSLEVCRQIWSSHEAEIRRAGDLLYEWQYEVRWAVDVLRMDGQVRPARASPRGTWELAD